MREVYRSIVHVFYVQVGLADAEDPDSYPYGTEIGESGVLLGEKGVAVLAPEDGNVEVVLYRGEGDPGGDQLAAGEITIGEEGLLVGTPPEFASVPWPEGQASIKVYTEGRPRLPRRVLFVLNPVMYVEPAD